LRYYRIGVRLLLFTIVAAAGALALASGQTASTSGLPQLSVTIDRTTRLLVIAPHPDDEAIGAAGLIQRVRSRGGSVHVVLLTSGDGFPEGVEVAEGVAHPRPSDYRGYGVQREQETRTAMQTLGVARDAVTFLGFPDEGLCRIASTYLFDKRRSFESPYTGREGPPPTEQIVRGARYRGIDLRRELERLVAGFQPTLIALPNPEDEHPDHCSTHIFSREALGVESAQAQRRVHVLHYLVHFGQWPLTADSGIGTVLNPPDGFPRVGRWESLTLTGAEAETKKRALLAYSTQMQVIGRFLLAFGRTNELFLEGEPLPTPDCWCDGVNIATDAEPSKDRRSPTRP
jgi:LmbE family N-acetylglucosaminyl deacetylase